MASQSNNLFAFKKFAIKKSFVSCFIIPLNDKNKKRTQNECTKIHQHMEILFSTFR